ncbi:hypothetical protein ACFW9N_19635 [Streptomyces sp. NPDC059496]|uniref:hypothetical protein n=1 Tax=Streptomyces sp. NPDC059496 TaxID=3346851 RepID=UPI0036D1F83E
MSIGLDFPEFLYEQPRGGITCWQKPRNGVLVVVDQMPFKTGDEVTFHITVCSDATGQTPAAEIQGVARITADTTSASYTIVWDGVLDAVTEGSVIAFYTLAPRRGQRVIGLAGSRRPVLPSTARRRCVRSGQLSRVGQVLAPAAVPRVESPCRSCPHRRDEQPGISRGVATYRLPGGRSSLLRRGGAVVWRSRRGAQGVGSERLEGGLGRVG